MVALQLIGWRWPGLLQRLREMGREPCRQPEVAGADHHGPASVRPHRGHSCVSCCCSSQQEEASMSFASGLAVCQNKTYLQACLQPTLTWKPETTVMQRSPSYSLTWNLGTPAHVNWTNQWRFHQGPSEDCSCMDDPRWEERKNHSGATPPKHKKA